MSAEEPGLPSPAGMDATWGLLDDIMLGGGLDQTSGLTGAPSRVPSRLLTCCSLPDFG